MGNIYLVVFTISRPMASKKKIKCIFIIFFVVVLRSNPNLILCDEMIQMNVTPCRFGEEIIHLLQSVSQFNSQNLN